MTYLHFICIYLFIILKDEHVVNGKTLSRQRQNSAYEVKVLAETIYSRGG